MYFKSSATAITITSNHSNGGVIKLENLDAGTSPPHILASRGDLHSLKNSIKVFGLTLKERDANKATLLHHASNANQLRVMQFLIESGIELDAVDQAGNAALHLAAMACHADSISLLLESGASCSILNCESNSPLHLAARDMTGNSLKACLTCPTDIYVRGPRNRTLLHVLAETDNIEGCEAMKEFMKTQQLGSFSEPLKVSDDDGFTPVHLAARNNSYNVLERIITVWKEVCHSPAILFDLVDEENSTPLHVAIDAGNYDAACVLLKYGACPFLLKEDIPPPLHLACSLGRLDIVKAMVRYAGVDILHQLDCNQRCPLHYSALSIHSTSIISYIMEESHDININQQDSNGKTPLHVSISSGNLASVKEFLERGSDPLLKDKKGSNALHLAVLHNRKPIIRELLQVPNCNRLITETDCMGHSPIHIGLRLGLVDTMLNLIYPFLMQHRSLCMNVNDSHGNSYLHLAASSGNSKFLQVFLECPNAQKLLNRSNLCGNTPLHSAAKEGRSYCIEHLLNRGAMVHKSSKGVTPLMLACAEGHVDCAKLLYEAHPFQLDWQDDVGDTALHHSTRSGSPSMIQYMLDLNSKILHNDCGQSFLDLITVSHDEDCALAVVNHKRWQECLDVISPVGDAPMLSLIKRMPAIAKTVLDRCYKKDSSWHELYYSEDFNFKYLLSHDGDSQLLTAQREQLVNSPSPARKLQKFCVEKDHCLFNIQKTVARKTLCPDSKKEEEVSQTMNVLMEMVHHKQINLLIHPVVLKYLKIKWRKYGRFCYFIYCLLALFNVVFLTSFVIFGSSPSPSGNSSSSLLEQDVVSDNATLAEDSFQMNMVGEVLRWLTVFCNTVMVGIVITILVRLRSRCIFLLGYPQFWMTLTCSTTLSYVFLLHPNPFTAKVVPVGAAACFLAWLVLFGCIQCLPILGIYVTMFYRVLRRALSVLFLSLVLLMAFAVPLFFLGRNITEFSNLGFSLFSVFGYMLGEVQYSLFIENNNTNSKLLIVLVTVLAVMMSIVMANLLIGLAVDDIEKIKRNALYDKVLLEVDFFFHLDESLPRMIVNLSAKLHHRRVVDDCNLKWWQKVWRGVGMLYSKQSRKGISTHDMNETIDAPVVIAYELAQIKKKLQEMSDIVVRDKDRSFDHQRRSQRLRWQIPESSSASLDSNFSDCL